MTEDHHEPSPSLAWHPANHPCPRCSRPIKARGTASFSKLIELICTKCGWRLNVEAIRVALKATTVTPNPDQEIPADVHSHPQLPKPKKRRAPK